MHVYTHINTNTYLYFINLCYQAAFWLTIFFLFSFTLTFLSAVSVQKKVALTNTSKAYLCSLNFSVHKIAFAYKILINDWSLVSLLKNL